MSLSDPEKPEVKTTATGTAAVAAGQITNSAVTTNVDQSTHLAPIAPSSRIAALLNRYHEEASSDHRTGEIIAELKRFTAPVVDDPLSLAEKLKAGNRADLVNFATETKEVFVKKLAKFTLFESAQAIHVHVLSRIYSVFETQILPMIRANAPRDKVELAIQHRIIEPVLADLQENPFGYSHLEIHGMVYYLTGNCKIVWA
jgi:hypothetical protein